MSYRHSRSAVVPSTLSRWSGGRIGGGHRAAGDAGGSTAQSHGEHRSSTACARLPTCRCSDLVRRTGGSCTAPVMADLVEGLSRLSSTIYVAIGQSQGQTLLPLPPANAAAHPDRASERRSGCTRARLR